MLSKSFQVLLLRWDFSFSEEEESLKHENKCLCLVCAAPFSSLMAKFNISESIYYINGNIVYQKVSERRRRSLPKESEAQIHMLRFHIILNTYVLLNISKSLILLILEFRRKRLICDIEKEK